MKILLINKFHYLRGGAERAYFDTARILEERGHEVAFFSMKHPQNIQTPWSKYFVQNVDYRAQYTIFQQFHLGLGMIWNREAQKNLSLLLDAFQPDVVHLHNIYHQLSPSIIPTIKKRDIPLVMTLHDYKLICPNYSLFVRGNIWEGGAFRCMTDRCIRNAFVPSVLCSLERIFHEMIGVYRKVDTFLSPSLFLKEKFQEHGFLGDIEIVSQPIQQIKEEGSAHHKEHILYAGRLSEEKGIDVLLSALTQTPRLSLRVAGDGPKRVYLKKLAKKLSIENQVSFLGHLGNREIKEELAQAKALVIPSVWYENMPYALTEALGSGQVVIASRLGGMTERIVHGENGFLFEKGNVEELATLLKSLEGKDLSSLREKARESVKDLNEKRYYQQLMKMYQKK